MNRIYLIVLSVAALLLAASCDKNELREEFVQTTDELGLIIHGVPAFEYKAETCQVGYNTAKKEYRISDDKMSEYVILTVDKIPSLDGETTGTLTYTTETNIITKTGLHLKLVKQKSSALGNTMWYWNKKNSIGIIVTSIN